MSEFTQGATSISYRPPARCAMPGEKRLSEAPEPAAKRPKTADAAPSGTPASSAPVTQHIQPGPCEVFNPAMGRRRVPNGRFSWIEFATQPLPPEIAQPACVPEGPLPLPWLPERPARSFPALAFALVIPWWAQDCYWCGQTWGAQGVVTE